MNTGKRQLTNGGLCRRATRNSIRFLGQEPQCETRLTMQICAHIYVSH